MEYTPFKYGNNGYKPHFFTIIRQLSEHRSLGCREPGGLLLSTSERKAEYYGDLGGSNKSRISYD